MIVEIGDDVGTIDRWSNGNRIAMCNRAIIIVYGQAYPVATGLVVTMVGIPGGGAAAVSKAPGCRRCCCAYYGCVREYNFPWIGRGRMRYEGGDQVTGRSCRALHMYSVAGFTHAGGHSAIVGAVINMQAYVVMAGIGINMCRVKDIACAAISKVPADGVGIGGAGGCVGEMNLTRVISRGSGGEAGGEITVLRKGTKRAD